MMVTLAWTITGWHRQWFPQQSELPLRDRLDVAQVLGANGRELFSRVVLPLTLPHEPTRPIPLSYAPSANTDLRLKPSSESLGDPYAESVPPPMSSSSRS